MKSLADALGLPSPGSAEPRSAPRFDKLTPKQFCQAILASPEFRTYILNGITLGDLPPQVILRMMDIGWGKPVERVEVKDTTEPLEALTVEQLENRALFLADVARRMRAASSQDDSGQVH